MKVYLNYLGTTSPDFFQGCSNPYIAIMLFPCDDPQFIVDSIYDELEYMEDSFLVEKDDIKDMADFLFNHWELEFLYMEDEEDLPEIYSYVALVPD